jgi:hypothetical protein
MDSFYSLTAEAAQG